MQLASKMTSETKPFCKTLVLDAGPLLSLSPLRGISETYYTVPQVLAELKDKNAKEHLERLGLNFGIKIEVKNPDPASMVSGTYIYRCCAIYQFMMSSYPVGEENWRLRCPFTSRSICAGFDTHVTRTSNKAKKSY